MNKEQNIEVLLRRNSCFEELAHRDLLYALPALTFGAMQFGNIMNRHVFSDQIWVLYR
jgi:hypothetical protein